MNDKQSPPNEPLILSLSLASFLKHIIKHGHINGIKPQSIGSTLLAVADAFQNIKYFCLLLNRLR